jgi:hypothetical protein
MNVEIPSTASPNGGDYKPVPKRKHKKHKRCEHGRSKYECRDCGGSAFCMHDKRKTICHECGGSSLCKHQRVRTKCKDCKGVGICKHNRRKEICQDCRGKQICSHDKQRWRCKDCKTATQISQLSIFCKVCLETRINPPRTLCSSCELTAPPRIELVIRPVLHELVGFPPSACDNLMLGGTQCISSARRPDNMWISPMFDRAVIVEVDEHGHPRNETSCEYAKVQDQASALYTLKPGIKVFHVRFDPNDNTGPDGQVPLNDRVRKVAEFTRALLSMDLSGIDADVAPYVCFLFYNTHGKAAEHVQYAVTPEGRQRVRLFTIDLNSSVPVLLTF